ncbi:unnamed protein product [Haemonchus placei]|uniref:BEACH-type PH domain-containing protein n=1 Tax=Haemonchus placei TaxID=6290 RepID=A0A0N4X971_HAEPC|nr:unnamed protein product [Haemonchus placei]
MTSLFVNDDVEESYDDGPEERILNRAGLLVRRSFHPLLFDQKSATVKIDEITCSELFDFSERRVPRFNV